MRSTLFILYAFTRHGAVCAWTANPVMREISARRVNGAVETWMLAGFPGLWFVRPVCWAVYFALYPVRLIRGTVGR